MILRAKDDNFHKTFFDYYKILGPILMCSTMKKNETFRVSMDNKINEELKI